MMMYYSVVYIYDFVVFGVFWYLGLNVFYIWDFGDGNKLCIQVNLIDYMYIIFGMYYVILIVVNFVNKINVGLVIVVFDFIEGFRFLKFIEVKVVGLMIKIEWEMVKGINIIYVVDFGDGCL